MARAKPKRTRRLIFTKILRHHRKETKLQSEVEIKVKPALLHKKRAIGDFVLNFVAMATGLVVVEFD